MGASEKIKKNYISIEEYFRLEEQSEIRHEYFDGEVFAMAGTTLNHNEITQNIVLKLREKFRSKGCRVLSESVKLEAVKHFYYPYPDIMLTCDAEDIKADYLIKKPTLIVEVLSKSSLSHDRMFKWKRYKTIPSLKYYLIVSQYELFVELYTRIENSDAWIYESFEKETDTLLLKGLDFELSLAEIYAGIEMNEEDREKEEDYLNLG